MAYVGEHVRGMPRSYDVLLGRRGPDLLVIAGPTAPAVHLRWFRRMFSLTESLI